MHDFKQIDLYSSKLHRSMEHHKADYKAHFNSTVEKLLKALHSISQKSHSNNDMFVQYMPTQ